MIKKTMLLGLGACLVATSAQAYVVNMNGFDDFGTSWDNPAESNTLANVLSNMESEMGGSLTLNLVDVETWEGFGATSVILEEIAGYAPRTTFGWYDVNDTNTHNQIFAGSDNASSDAVTINFGEYTNFGLYIEANGDVNNSYYTESALNGGYIQALVFEIAEQANSYVIAWEDLPMWGHTDADYQDMIVRVTVDVPEPATLALFALGLLGLGLSRRRGQLAAN